MTTPPSHPTGSVRPRAVHNYGPKQKAPATLGELYADEINKYGDPRNLVNAINSYDRSDAFASGRGNAVRTFITSEQFQINGSEVQDLSGNPIAGVDFDSAKALKAGVTEFRTVSPLKEEAIDLALGEGILHHGHLRKDDQEIVRTRLMNGKKMTQRAYKKAQEESQAWRDANNDMLYISNALATGIDPKTLTNDFSKSKPETVYTGAKNAAERIQLAIGAKILRMIPVGKPREDHADPNDARVERKKRAPKNIVGLLGLAAVTILGIKYGSELFSGSDAAHHAANTQGLKPTPTGSSSAIHNTVTASPSPTSTPSTSAHNTLTPSASTSPNTSPSTSATHSSVSASPTHPKTSTAHSSVSPSPSKANTSGSHSSTAPSQHPGSTGRTSGGTNNPNQTPGSGSGSNNPNQTPGSGSSANTSGNETIAQEAKGSKQPYVEQQYREVLAKHGIKTEAKIFQMMQNDAAKYMKAHPHSFRIHHTGNPNVFWYEVKDAKGHWTSDTSTVMNAIADHKAMVAKATKTAAKVVQHHATTTGSGGTTHTVTTVNHHVPLTSHPNAHQLKVDQTRIFSTDPTRAAADANYSHLVDAFTPGGADFRGVHTAAEYAQRMTQHDIRIYNNLDLALSKAQQVNHLKDTGNGQLQVLVNGNWIKPDTQAHTDAIVHYLHSLLNKKETDDATDAVVKALAK